MTKCINKTVVVCWWSGGITSAVACYLAIKLFGKENVRVIMIDTKNEHKDTYRFLKDCEKWYGVKIERIWNPKYDSIVDVWYKFQGMNFAFGAICSSELKRAVRKQWQKENNYDYQVFGYEFGKEEFNRASGMSLNYPDAKAIYPLLMYGYDKPDCIKFVEDAGIEIPVAYKLGLHNNNCLQTGCVQGGLSYWYLFSKINPWGYLIMGIIEHKISELKGKPVTINKDQSKAAKQSGMWNVFLLPNPNYPNHKCLFDMKGINKPPKPLIDCNGFCGINDLSEKSETENEIFRQDSTEYDNQQLSIF